MPCKYHTHDEMRAILTQLKGAPDSVRALLVGALGATELHDMAVTLTVNEMLPVAARTGSIGKYYYQVTGAIPTTIHTQIPYEVCDTLTLNPENKNYPYFEVPVMDVLAKHTEIFGPRLPLWVGGEKGWAASVSPDPWDRKNTERETWRQCSETFFWDVDRKGVEAVAYYDLPQSAWTALAKEIAPGCKVKPYLRIDIASTHQREGFSICCRFYGPRKNQHDQGELLAVERYLPEWNIITSHGGYGPNGPYPSDRQTFWR